MGTVLGTLLSWACLGGFLLWCWPALLCLNLDVREFLLIASPLVSLGYGLCLGLEGMATNRCRRLVWAATVPFLQAGSGSD